MSDTNAIFIDASQPAILIQDGTETNCATLQEAVLEWRRLSPERRNHATIHTVGRTFVAHEIERLHYAETAR